MKRNETAFNIAYSGVACALSVVILFSAVIPSLVYIAPAAAGFVIWSVRAQTSVRYGTAAFITTAILALFLTPEIEGKLYFIAFFGYYPILREQIHRIKSRAARLIRFALKSAIFNITAVSSFWIAVHVFGITEALEELTWGGANAVYVFWGLGNIAFWLYDFALTQFFQAFERWVRPAFNKRTK
ncbi:MAG: hypothetical protein FWD35_04315 [Oscillospiraceae bacterium]|nr:hypothetical protein [Oscillospiraceae bacterium]